MLPEIDTGYYHGMFGFVDAGGKLRAAKFLEDSFAAHMKSGDRQERAELPEQRDRMKVLYT